MTALESADEIEAVTAITFLLSLVIKRYMYKFIEFVFIIYT